MAKKARSIYVYSMSRRIRFYLDIPREEYLRFYQGNAQSVSVKAEDGRQVQFPAANLRAFVGHQGIQGHFEITLGEGNKLLAIRRIWPKIPGPRSTNS
jgi:hypothetical protein